MFLERGVPSSCMLNESHKVNIFVGGERSGRSTAAQQGSLKCLGSMSLFRKCLYHLPSSTQLFLEREVCIDLVWF